MADRHPYLDHDGPIPFAHRGGAGDWPENTLPAFQGAVDLGFSYVETDVHATADGVLVAFHDDRLDRVTDHTGLISELRWSDVAAARVDGVEPIPRFDDLVTAFPDMRLNIDPKADNSVEPLIAALRTHHLLDRVCVGAFSDARVTRFADEFGPDLCLGMGPREVARLRLSSWRLPVGSFRGRCAQVPVRRGRVPIVDNRFVAMAHQLDIAVHVWTIDEPDEMHDLLDLGVDGLMTDRPAILRSVFEERGLWSAGG
jgi:glycerophosphoryl diester phosphodiesterase